MKKIDWSIEYIIRKLLDGVDRSKLALEDEREFRKFRKNMAKLISNLLKEPPERKQMGVNAIKAGAFQIIASIPVVTPIITAMLQVVSGEDLGSKIDGLRDYLGNKLDRIAKELHEDHIQILNELRKG
jgi:hypothetical protein